MLVAPKVAIVMVSEGQEKDDSSKEFCEVAREAANALNADLCER